MHLNSYVISYNNIKIRNQMSMELEIIISSKNGND